MPDQQNLESDKDFGTSDPDVVARIRDMAAMARDRELAELTVAQDGVEITIRRASLLTVASAAAPVRHRDSESVAQDAVDTEDGVHVVVSPMVGVFYTSPMPEAPPFVHTGDEVSPGDIVGLVEAMKIFNEVATEVGGEVIEILAHNEEFVKLGQPLVKIRVP